MKAEKTPASNRRTTVSAGTNPSQAGRTAASAVGAKSERSRDAPARLSREERQFAVGLATDFRGERGSYYDGAAEQDWLEAEIEVEVARMRQRNSHPAD